MTALPFLLFLQFASLARHLSLSLLQPDFSFSSLAFCVCGYAFGFPCLLSLIACSFPYLLSLIGCRFPCLLSLIACCFPCLLSLSLSAVSPCLLSLISCRFPSLLSRTLACFRFRCYLPLSLTCLSRFASSFSFAYSFNWYCAVPGSLALPICSALPAVSVLSRCLFLPRRQPFLFCFVAYLFCAACHFSSLALLQGSALPAASVLLRSALLAVSPPLCQPFHLRFAFCCQFVLLLLAISASEAGKQSEKNTALQAALLTDGFHRCAVDKALFLKDNPSSTGHPTRLWLVVYVDDLLLMSACEGEVEAAFNALGSKFHLSRILPVTMYLGIEIETDQVGRQLFIHQRRYIQETTVGLQGGTVRTPLTDKLRLEPHALPYKTVTEYLSRVGKISFATHSTRPDLAWAHSWLARGNTQHTF